MIILASASKRRIRLIKKITNNFKCEKPLIDEDNFNYLNNSILSKELSKLKAYSILKEEYKNDLIISADTVVIYKNNILHKPRNRIEAFNTFTEVYVMTSGTQSAPASAVKVLVMDIYQNAFRFFRMGYASAESVCLFLVVLLFSMLQLFLVRNKEAK